MRRSAIICTLLLSAVPGFVRLAAQDLGPQAEPSASSRPTVRDILVISDSQSLNLEISTDTPIVPENQRLEHPDRLVFDFPGLALQGSTQHILVNKGPVIAVRTSLFKASPPIARIVVDLKEPLEAEIRSVGNRVSIRIPFAATGAGPDSAEPRYGSTTCSGGIHSTSSDPAAPASSSRTLSKRPFTAGLAHMTCWRKPDPSA